MQPLFDCACSAWYPNLTQKLKKKIQIIQNKFSHFYFQLGNMSTISDKEFKGLNWLPVSTRFQKCVISIVFKFINDNCLCYSNEVFEFEPEVNVCLRNNFLRWLWSQKYLNLGQT